LEIGSPIFPFWREENFFEVFGGRKPLDLGNKRLYYRGVLPVILGNFL